MTKFAVSLLVAFVLVSATYAQTRRSAPALKNDRPSPKRGAPALSKPSDQPPPPPPAAVEDDEVVLVETNLITTPVSVLDRNGRFIPGLQKKDFKIYENDVPQAITYFQSSEQPFTVVLMIDTSPSTRYHIDEIHYAAVTFVNQLRTTDKVMVVAFDQRLKILSEPTTEKKTLYAAIYKAQFGSGTSLYDAVNYITDLDVITTLGRKAVVLFTDGVDTTSRQSDYQSTVSAVEETDALFYPIRYNTQQRGDANAIAQVMPLPPNILARLGRGSTDAEYLTGKTYLETLATNSGGRIFEADALTNLEDSFKGVAEELRRQYSIGYYASENGKAGDRKRIKIQVTRPPRAVIRAKTNYVVKQKPDEKPQASSTSPSGF